MEKLGEATHIIINDVTLSPCIKVHARKTASGSFEDHPFVGRSTLAKIRLVLAD